MKHWPLVLLVSVSPLLSQKPGAGWVLTFADEFNSAELDLSRWVSHDPGRDVSDRQSEFSVSGGQLHLTSGVVGTFGVFAQTYGRFEIRCKVAAGRGRHGFRLLPIPFGKLPMIDVFEIAGSAASRVSFANHWGTEQTERSFGDSFAAPDLSAGFHVLAVEWDKDRIAWFIDGKQKFQAVDGIPHQPMYLMLDFVGDIDYVRVYQHP
jgi:beta-glucanase (GH16 family)